MQNDWEQLVEQRIDELGKKVRYCERCEELREDIKQLKKAVGLVNGKNLSNRTTETSKDIDRLKEDQKNMEKNFDKLNKKIDNFYIWLIGGMGALVLNLILQVIQINGGS